MSVAPLLLLPVIADGKRSLTPVGSGAAMACGSLERRLARGDPDAQQPPSLLTTARHDGQQSLRKSTARFAVRTEAAFAPRHPRPQFGRHWRTRLCVAAVVP